MFTRLLGLVCSGWVSSRKIFWSLEFVDQVRHSCSRTQSNVKRMSLVEGCLV
jgi:hypothetical protein